MNSGAVQIFETSNIAQTCRLFGGCQKSSYNMNLRRLSFGAVFSLRSIILIVQNECRVFLHSNHFTSFIYYPLIVSEQNCTQHERFDIFLSQIF